MITPYEIETKDFSKSMRGYNMEEVDDFLDLIILDLQQILAENETLKKNLKTMEANLNQYKRSETSVMNTLESAKKLMNDISESAEKRAEIIIKNAQMEADALQRDAKENISKLTEEGEKLRSKVTRYREKFRQLLEDQLNQIEGSSEELFADLERDFMPASLDEQHPAQVQKPASVPLEQTGPVAERRQTVSDTQVRPRTAGPTDTMVVSDKSLEEMLMEQFGAAETTNKTMVRQDLSKTRVVK